MWRPVCSVVILLFDILSAGFGTLRRYRRPYWKIAIGCYSEAFLIKCPASVNVIVRGQTKRKTSELHPLSVPLITTQI